MSKLGKKIFWISILFLIGSCENSKRENKVSDLLKANNPIEKDSSENETSSATVNEELLQPKQDEFGGYTFKFGYEKYDEDKFGFGNPGFLIVLKNEKVIFNDSFKGEGEVYVKSLGYQKFSGNKLLFILNWGTEACDFSQHSKYYIITPEDRVLYLNEYWSFSGGDGYASRYFEQILPKDSFGLTDKLVIIEGMKYHEHDQPDLSDTTIISFTQDRININKMTNNLAKGK